MDLQSISGDGKLYYQPTAMKSNNDYIKEFDEKFPYHHEGPFDFEHEVFDPSVIPVNVRSFLLQALNERTADIIESIPDDGVGTKREFNHTVLKSQLKSKYL